MINSNDVTCIYSIFCGTILFVIGQYFLRKSFNNDNDYTATWLIFTLTFGLIACIVILGLYIIDKQYIINTLSNEKRPKLLCAIAAAFFFVFGNIFWIYSISTRNSIGGIRTIMAGFETMLLFLLGFIAFYEKFDIYKIIGIIMILGGIYVLT